MSDDDTHKRAPRARRPRWPNFDRKAEVAWVREKRKTMLSGMVRDEKTLLAERISATRKLFRRKVSLCDVHSHTVFSDGVSTIAENMEIGLLMNDRVFVPRCDSVAADFRRAQKAAPFVWIPHPTGYARNHWYPDRVVRNLWELGDRFAMEVLNGASKISRAYNAISARAVAVWDELLCAGRRVTVLGASDAHMCCSIGTAWTGVYPANAKNVVAALSMGHSFASEAPLLWLSCGRRIMGDEVRRRAGTRISIRFIAADAAGLHSVRIVSNGKVVREVMGNDAPLVPGLLETRIQPKPSYFRLECTSADQRRAFSSPIFFLPL